MKKISLLIAGAVLLFSCAGKESVLQEEKRNDITRISAEKQKTDAVKYNIKCKNLKIGVILPLTGDSADSGLKIKNGVELAISTFNKQNNTEITSLYQDTEGGEALLEEFYRVQSIDPLVAGIIGPVQDNLLPKIRTLAESCKLVTVSPSAAALIKSKGDQYFFSDAVFPEDEGRVMAEFMVNTLKKKKAGVIYPSDNLYGKACARAFRDELIKLGGEVTKEEKFEEGSFDYKEQMVSLGGIDPHIIKDIMSADKDNLESIVAKLVTQVRAFLPSATEKKKNTIALVKFINSGRDEEQLSEEMDYGRIISEKLSYGLGKFKDTKLTRLAEVKQYIEKNGCDKQALASHFEAAVVITGAIFEKNPLSYSARVTVENMEEKNVFGISFDFTVSDKLITNPEGLEVIYLPVSLYDAESIISHLVFFELKMPYLGSSGFNDRKFIANMKLSDSEIYFTAGFNPGSAVPIVAGFIQSYKDTYFELPDYYSAAAYDAANILLQAIGLGAGTKEEVKNAINNISSIDLVTGAAAYTEGGIKKDLHIMGIYEKELIEIK
ncbi:MAG: ABC transporter substrate-binding protein [Candidatus Firestonebacteria bacterium]